MLTSSRSYLEEADPLESLGVPLADEPARVQQGVHIAVAVGLGLEGVTARVQHTHKGMEREGVSSDKLTPFSQSFSRDLWEASGLVTSQSEREGWGWVGE